MKSDSLTADNLLPKALPGLDPRPPSGLMSLPNLLTISRIPLMFAVCGCMYAGFTWAPTIAFWLFILAGLTDWLDGKLARERNEVSLFGRFMDAVTDKVLVLGLLIALVNGDYFNGYNTAAMLLLLCVLCREFAISGLRMAAAASGVIMEADRGGKLKTFMQLNAIGWLMAARMFEVDHRALFSGSDHSVVTFVRVVGCILYGTSAVLAITSCVSYFRRHGRVLFKE